jgi:GTPase SAR1 family protein
VTEEKVAVFFVGTAGSGKSSLVAAFRRWMENESYSALTVNLDPGIDAPAYEPDVDVRDWVVLHEIMEQFGLGPNGAQVAAADMMALQAADIWKSVEAMDADYVLYDAPGQLELFAFRGSSRRLIETLGGSKPMVAYLYDPMLVITPNGLVSSMLLGATVHFRLDVPMVNLLSKVDILKEEDRERVTAWAADKWAVYNALTDGVVTPSTTLSVEVLQAMESLGAIGPLVQVSSATGEGLEDLYTAIQLVYAGGDDLEKR